MFSLGCGAILVLLTVCSLQLTASQEQQGSPNTSNSTTFSAAVRQCSPTNITFNLSADFQTSPQNTICYGENVTLSCTPTRSDFVLWYVSNGALSYIQQEASEGSTSNITLPCGTYTVRCAYNNETDGIYIGESVYISKGTFLLWPQSKTCQADNMTFNCLTSDPDDVVQTYWYLDDQLIPTNFTRFGGHQLTLPCDSKYDDKTVKCTIELKAGNITNGMGKINVSASMSTGDGTTSASKYNIIFSMLIIWMFCSFV